MKNRFLHQLIPVTLLIITSQSAFSQAEEDLSNLITPTKVNQNLLPNTDNTKDLGSITKSWRNIYLDGALYLKGIPMAKGLPDASLTFYGWEAGNANTTGFDNSAFGYRALALNTTGVQNSAFGLEALYANASETHNNNAFGYASLHTNAGLNNNAFGSAAMYVNGTGSNNCAFGTYSLYSNGKGYGNAAFGNWSLENNKSGNYNIAIGYASLHSSQNNSHNIAIGDSALYSYNDGKFEDYMVGVGYNAMKNNTTGYYNTALGGLSLQINKTGWGNTALGAFADVNKSTRYNATAVGYQAIALEDNQVMLGNTALTSVWSGAGYIIFSDGRFKKNVNENVPGLDFINKLRPVTYQYDIHGMNDHISREANTVNKDNGRISLDQAAEIAISNKEKKIYTGFVAQDVETAASNLGYDFSGVHKPSSDKDLYGLSYSDFVVPLVKAVQELSKQNELQQKEIDELKAILLSANKGDVSSGANSPAEGVLHKLQIQKLTNALLEQNTPNPFNQSTTIRYSLPSTIKSAKIIITDYTGKVVKQINVSAVNKGIINIEAGSLSSGTYNYSLIVNDKVIDTKRMVVTKKF